MFRLTPFFMIIVGFLGMVFLGLNGQTVEVALPFGILMLVGMLLSATLSTKRIGPKEGDSKMVQNTGFFAERIAKMIGVIFLLLILWAVLTGPPPDSQRPFGPNSGFLQ